LDANTPFPQILQGFIPLSGCLSSFWQKCGSPVSKLHGTHFSFFVLLYAISVPQYLQ
jgi:hypothetical protein